MAIEYLVFDEDGDLLLLLGQPSIPDSKDIGVTECIDPELAMSAYEKAVEAPMDSIEIANDDSETLVMEIDDNDVEEDVAPASDLSQPVSEMHMLVSSKTLMIASPVFKAMLQKGHFKEGSELEAGKAEVSLDDDPTAFKILMDILHFNNRKVPRAVDLKTMANMAVLVDKYQLLESVEVFAERWIANLRGFMPTTLTGDVLPWLCICWVFQSSATEDLKQIVSVALKWSDGTMGVNITQDLPIPGRVLGEIERRRQILLREALRPLKRLLDKYLNPTTNNTLCRGAYSESKKVRRNICDKAMLGSIIASAKVNGLYPLPTFPFTGRCLGATFKSLLALDIVAGCDDPSINWPVGKSPTYPGHGGKREISHHVLDLINKVNSFKLIHFVEVDLDA